MSRRRKKQNQDFWPVGMIALLAVPILMSLYRQISLTVFYIGILTIGTLILLIIFLLKRYREKQLSLSGIEAIDKMKGTEFELYLKAVLRRRGYAAKITKKDLGTDLVVKKDGESWGIQAKRYKVGSNVPLDAVRQVVASAGYYGCSRTMVVTNSYFTRNAKTIADKNRCVLVNRESLISFLLDEGSFLGGM